MSREEWIEAARKKLIATFKHFDDEKPNDYQTWAESLAETYYDERPNEYSPDDAVNEELSYA
jgi:hypothetical protein